MRSGFDWKAGTLNALRAGLQENFREHMALGAEGAVDFMQLVLRDAVRNAPARTGRLRKSGRVFRRKARKASFHIVKIRFGSRRRGGKRSKRAADYAAIVHFNTNLRHKVGDAMFLYDALSKRARSLPAHISTRWKVR